MPSRVAAIDLGTNSVRLDILEKNGRAKVLFRDKIMVRLGQRVFDTGKLHKSAIERTLSALNQYSEVCESFKAKEIVAFGTSALRTAKNSDTFVERVKSELDIDIKIISGVEEAEFIFSGITMDRRAKSKRFAFVDIGGGSTEIGAGEGGKPYFLESFKLGAARLRQRCSGVEEYREIVADRFKNEKKIYPTPEIVLGSSGTIKALKNMLGERTIRYKALKRLISKLDGMSIEEIEMLPGLPERRADIILPGAVILEGVMRYLGTKEVRFTKFAMRDGIVKKITA